MKLEFTISDKLARLLERGLFRSIDKIHRSLDKIMANQQEFDAQIARANAALDTISEQITAEAQQIRDYIDEHPDVDTTALEGVVARLESVNVSGIFEPAPAGGEEGGEETGTGEETEA